MPTDILKDIRQFGGLKDDEDPKQIPFEFFTRVKNFNYPKDGVFGIQKILFPTQISQTGIARVDGLFEYRYLDGSNVLQTEAIAVSNGFIFKNATTANAAQTVTFTANPTNTVNLTSQPFSNGDAVIFGVTGSGALPASLTAGTIYYVVGATENAFQVALTVGGAAIVFATAGTAGQYVKKIPTILKSGLTAGLCSFVTFNDKLFIANGKNYVNIYYGSLGLVSEMGAPVAVGLATAGNVNVGAHYYAMTYVTAGGEEVLGSVSNTVTIASSAKQVTLHLPIGYKGTISRNIYRTEAGGTALKLLVSIANNTDLTYTDNIADASLTTAIPATNNELPKPYFLAVVNQSLYGAKADKYPTQIFRTTANNEVFDLASFIDVANYGNDNTPVNGIGVDFGKVIVGTGKNLYIVEPSDTVVNVSTVKPTRANVGIKSGYTVKSVPAFGDFRGGLMFVSTLNDVRIMSGMDEIPVATVINNVQTENWAQNIRGSLSGALASYSNIYAEFFDYKYHLAIDNIKYVLDIRLKGWMTHDIRTGSYQSKPRCFAVFNDKLYNGQSDGFIESEYYGTTYRGQEVPAYLESGHLAVDSKYKFAQKMDLWFKLGSSATVEVSVIADDNDYFPITSAFTLTGGAFNATYFNSTYFNTASGGMDYRTLNINTPCRWYKYVLSNNAGIVNFQGLRATGQLLASKRGAA